MSLTSNLKSVYVVSPVADVELEAELELDKEVNRDLGILLVDGLDLDGCK